MGTRLIRSAILAATLAALPGPAAAQSIIKDRSSHDRPPDLSLLLGIPIPFGFGAGMRFGIPVASDGFVASVNDAVFVEPGFQFVFWSDFDKERFGFQVPVLMRWDFFFTPEWTVFGTVGPTFGFFFGDGGGGGNGRFDVKGGDVFRPGAPPGFLHFGIGGGAFYNFSPESALRLDASTSMLAVGLVFRL